MAEDLLQQEIDLAIQKSLPSKVGELLKKELDDYARLKVEHKSCKVSRSEALDKIAELKAHLSDTNEFLKDAKSVLDREITISERERNQTIHGLVVRLEESEKRAEHAFEFTKMVFKSPIFRTSYINSLDNTYNQDGSGSNITGRPTEKTQSEE